MTYYIVGLIAIIFLYKIFEERGFGWSYLFSLLLYIVMGIIFNKFVPMFNYGPVRFGCEIALILLTLFIYCKAMYLLFNSVSVAAVFVVSAYACSLAFWYGMGIIYPQILDFLLNIVNNFI
ncbi:MAG: hypothetical protein IJ399_01835 [Bacilli bacterium]|nr:hypothetical protein [Bacilli bacterium]